MLVGLKNKKNNNNKQICISPLGRNFRGAGPGSVLVSRERRESPREEECLKPKLKNCNRVDITCIKDDFWFYFSKLV